MEIEKKSEPRHSGISPSCDDSLAREKLATIAAFERRLASLGFQVQVMGAKGLETEDVLDHVIGVALTIDELRVHPERIHFIGRS